MKGLWEFLNNIITLSNVSYTYNKGTPLEKKALNKISLSIDKGEFVAIIGHTGSGKSTLIQHMNGLLKPEEGSIVIDGQDTQGKGLKELRKKVGIVFQYPEHQLFEESVYKDIEFGLLKHHIPEEERKRRIKETASILELSDDLLEKSPYELSGGQKRRAAIAGILVLEPEILVLDEPVAGLDPAGCKELFNIVLQLHQSKKITVILVSHSMEIVADYANRIIVMENGQIVMDGLVNEIFSREDELRKINLSVPQIAKLMQLLNKKDDKINSQIFTVEKAYEEILKKVKKIHD